MNPSTPPSLAELKHRAAPIPNVNIEHRQQLSRLERLAVWITEHVGTMGFFLIIFSWTVLWLGWNILVPSTLSFDPFPAFVLWLFISNMIQIMLMPLIMVGQNLQSRHAERRAEVEFEVNTKSEREIEAILLHLENQDRLLKQILERMEQKSE
jgi:uncharacterized membrane protein